MRPRIVKVEVEVAQGAPALIQHQLRQEMVEQELQMQVLEVYFQ